MRILVVGLDGAAPEALLGFEELANVRRLMEAGCYGRLEGDPAPGGADAWERLAKAAAAKSVADPAGAGEGTKAGPAQSGAECTRRPFEALRRLVAGTEWDTLLCVVPGGGLSAPVRDEARSAWGVVDEEIGKLLETLEGETAILVVALSGAASRDGAFVLATPAVPPLGAIEGARRADLEPTLHALRGMEVPADLPGRNLLAGAAAVSPDEDEERLVKERLAGLGYI